MRIFEDLLNIVFPKLCCICSDALTTNEELICFHCRSELPKIKLDDYNDNEVTSRFVGKIKIDFGASYLYFHKSGSSQKLLHQFKYNNNPEIGEMIGKWFGHELIKAKVDKQIDVIIPVPLHSRKQRKRGYNQSHFLSKGISEVLNIPIDFHSLIRTDYQKSQTHKTKEQRWKSVENAFKVIAPRNIENKRVFMVDDVITTGATLEACGLQLLNCGASKLKYRNYGFGQIKKASNFRSLSNIL